MLDIDTAIKHCLEVVEQNETQAEKWREEGGEEWGKTTACCECATDHRQLTEWLTELKELREIIDACNILAVDAFAVVRLCKELKEAKRLLKAAVEDFSFVSEKFINSMDSSCSMFNHIAGCVKGCPMSSSDDYGRCKWRYADEALALIGDNVNGI